MRHTVRRKSLSLAVALACEAQWGPASQAQLAEPLPEPIRIEVTGSRIARIDGETALPVQVIGRDEILQGNWTTAAELMAHVAANFNGNSNATTLGSLTIPGSSTANLRGLGGRNTLVLLNGRRISNYAFSGRTVDLASIPLAAIERVEILKDGASSIYGTDAIAGVVNFITRKNFTGVEVTGQAGVTENGGGDHYQASATAGWGDLTKDRFNAFVTVDYQKDTALAANQRQFAATGNHPDEGLTKLEPATFPANILADAGRYVSPSFATGCLPPLSVPVRGACRFDAPNTVDLLPQQDQWNVVGRATWEWTSGQQLFAELVYSRNELTRRTSPTPASGPNTIDGRPIEYPEDGPYYPTQVAAANGLSGPLEVYFRLVPLGLRIDSVTTEAQRIVLGAQGTIAGWSYDAAYMHNASTADYAFIGGFVGSARIRAAMGTGLINPFGDSEPAGIALLQSMQVTGAARNATGKLDQFDFNLSRELLALPGGPLAIAWGGEARRESLTDEPSPLLASGDIVGFPFAISPQSASRNVGAVFAEVNLPMAKGLEIGASARYDYYSDFGSTSNPKVAVRWQPAPSLLLRGAWGTGFHAPPLPDLYTARSAVVVSNQFIYDPVRCPVTESVQDCTGEYAYIQGGNPNLSPVTSTQYTAGVIWEPVPGISLGVEWWKITTEFIGNYIPEFIVEQYGILGATHVLRGPVDPAYPTLPGPIVAFVGLNENIGTQSTSGIDVSIKARTTTDSLGAGNSRWTAPMSRIGSYPFHPYRRSMSRGSMPIFWCHAGGITHNSTGSSDRGAPRWRKRSSPATPTKIPHPMHPNAASELTAFGMCRACTPGFATPRLLSASATCWTPTRPFRISAVKPCKLATTLRTATRAGARSTRG